MPGYKRILCACDFDECSDSVLALAGSLTKESGAALYLLHVARMPSQDMDVPLATAENPRWERDARARLEQVAKLALKDGLHYEIIIRTGVPDEDIARAADELGADLIVMATHGRRGLKHLILGSVAEHVFKEANCPVIVIRPKKS